MSLIKVLVLGSTGMLGHRVMKVLSEKRLFAVTGHLFQNLRIHIILLLKKARET
jgi:aspartate-semialdehyde dehydrogenase